MLVPQRIITYRKVAALLALSVSALGTSVLVGYALRSQQLKSVLPGLVAMNPVTAISFILCGLALSALLHPASGPRARKVGVALAAAAAVIGIAKIMALLAGMDLVIDHLFFRDQMFDPLTGYHNRIAPNTAFNFVLLGTAIVALYKEKDPRAAQWLAVIAYFVGFLALQGYIFGVTYLTGVASHIPMALNTALGFMACASAVLLARPQEGVMLVISSDGPGGAIGRMLEPASMVIPTLIGIVLYAGTQNGLYEPSFSWALVVSANVIVFTFITWALAAKLHRIDAERAAASRALEEERERDRMLLASIGDGVAAIDVAWKIVRWNAAAEKITGWTAQQAVGKRLQDVLKLVNDQDGSPRTQFITDAMVTRQVRYLETGTMLVRKDGTPLAVSDSAAPVVDANGDLTGAIIVFRDASAEQEFIRKISEMARMKEDFLFRAIHDLRSPANIIRLALETHSEAVASLGKKPVLEKGIAMIREADERMVGLIEDLLSIAKGDNEAVTLKSEPVDLCALVRAAVEQLADFAKQKGVKVKVTCPKSRVIIMGDEGSLMEVMDNLINNAIKYGKEGGKAEVSVTTTGTGTKVTVADDGIGIQEAAVKKLFVPFYRAVGKEIAGTGLGLYIVKTLLEKMGARIGVTSVYGQGTAFTIDFPAAK